MSKLNANRPNSFRLQQIYFFSHAWKEACTVEEEVLIDQKEESTSTNMPLGTTIYNIEMMDN